MLLRQLRVGRLARPAMAAAVAAVLGSAMPALAIVSSGETLQDGNAVAMFNNASGLYSLTVAGKQQIVDQNYYYRVGSAGGESTIGTLTPTGVTLIPGDPSSPGSDTILHLSYAGSGFDLGVTYTLAGGTGHNSASLTEAVRVDNNTGSTLPFHLFEYDHFALNGSSGNQTAIFTDGNTTTQSDDMGALVQVVTTPSPDHFQVDTNGAILTSLNDSAPTTLNDFAGGVKGNPEFAYEWDPSISADGSYIISKVQTITPSAVPLPTSAWMGLGTLGMIGLAGLIRKRPLMA